jgi:site-specific DNA-methyltransferase (adenine-specific)
VIGNPPYNENSENSNGYKVCLYNLFVEKYINLATKLIFVIPSRWFASNGKIEKFRKMMLNRKDIRMIKHCPNSKDIFKNVDIEGGICYFFIDYKYSGLCEFNGIKLNLNKYDILVESRNYSIIEKIIKYSNFEDIYRSKGYFGVSLTNTNLKNTKTIDDEIVVYMSKQKGFIKYIDKKHITKNITKWKVITPSANGKRPCFGNIFIGKPNEVYSESYIGFEVKNEIEADSLLSYLKCKTTNFLLALRKNTQNISLKTLKWIPSVPLDRIWSDEQLYEYFNLHEVEINLINLGKV